jgi:hypothetical protein
LRKRPEGAARFAELPGVAGRATAYATAGKQLSSLLYRTQSTTVFKQADLKQYSSFGESERDFRLRMVQEMSELRDTTVEKLRDKYASKFTSLESKILTAQQRVEKEKNQLSDSRMRTAVSFGGAVMGAILGRKKVSVTNVRRAGSALRNFGRGTKEKEDIGMAEEKLEVLLEQKKELETQFQAEVDELSRQVAPAEIELEAIEVRPLKSDIALQQICLLWTPWQVDGSGIATPLFEAGVALEG